MDESAVSSAIILIVSIIIIIVFFYMASKLSAIAHSLKYLQEEVHQMRLTMKYYALRDGVLNDEGKFIKRVKKEKLSEK